MSFAIESSRVGAKVPPRLRIGDLLVASGALRPLDVQRIVASQRDSSKRFGEIALELKLITEAQLSCALAKQIGYPYVEYGRSQLAHSLAAAYEPFCDYAEALRTLRSQLLMRWFGREQRALAITCARRDGACSTVAGNLAIVFAQLGENTLLIDGNLREPQQHRLFGLGACNGLTELIGERCEVDEALQKIEPFEKLTVMPTGAQPPNPQELLSGSVFADVLEDLVQAFDVVIVNTPPLLDFADAAIVSQRAGACVLTARRHVTPTADLNRSKALLRPTGASLLGVVINE
jgi:receptor protein-tyrosine kinase